MNQVTIHNATSRMVLVPCNSGRNLFIPPRANSPEVAESEIRPNPRVEKLLRSKSIVVKVPSPEKKSPAPRPPRAARSPKTAEES